MTRPRWSPIDSCGASTAPRSTRQDAMGWGGFVIAERFRALDVETANADRASICQIGIVDVCKGEVIRQWQTLVDPEDWFDPFNTNIHGIDADAVQGKPTFPEIHKELCDVLTGCVVVSHTAFDRVAISRAMDRYGLLQPSIRWLDSARVARRAWSDRYGSSGYGLQNIACDLGIQYRAHNALEDARAAAEVVLHACAASGLSIAEWLTRIERPILPTARTQQRTRDSVRRNGDPEGPLYGEVVAFTGTLGISRREAAELAAVGGCRVADNVTKKTMIVVVGTQDRAVLGGYDKSRKHRRAEELIRQGSELRILSERDFRDFLNARSRQ